jgi:Fe-S cluster assembly ATP-binding protein
MNREDTPLFSCRDLHVAVEGKEIVKGVDLEIHAGEKHALMGPNGSGKSTLVAALMGHPSYQVSGEIFLAGEPVAQLAPDERARLGMFLGFQYPVAVPGVSVANFLRAALKSRRGEEIPVRAFRKEMQAAFAVLDMNQDFAGRYLNDGFSGGEKKRLEILQMLLLKPIFALLDETDSGLDIDALREVAAAVQALRAPARAIVVITHHQRLLDHLVPDRVHVLAGGRIVATGDKTLAVELEQRGYAWAAPQPAVRKEAV